MALAITIPMELITVQVNSANAFYTARSGASIDESHVAFVDSGEGIAFYGLKIPKNTAATPAWNLDFDHMTNIGSGGNVMVTFAARCLSNNLYDVAPTVVSSAAVFAVNSANNYQTATAASGATFDSVVTVSATQYLIVKVNRHGGNASDTLSDQWNLKGLNLVVSVTA